MRTVKRDIVGGFIFSADSKLLLGKNIKGGVYQDTWVVPGGGIDNGESKIEALTREMMEEVGIDISSAKIEEMSGGGKDTTEKTLRDTGERVLVDMTFYNYKITLSTTSDATSVQAEDDFKDATWFEVTDLPSLALSTPTARNIRTLGLVV